MSKKATSPDLSSSDVNEDASTSSTDNSRKRSSRKAKKTDSIKNYVADLLTKQTGDDDRRVDLTQTQMTIRTAGDKYPRYENSSAFRPYQTTNLDDNHRQKSSVTSTSSSDDDAIHPTHIDQVRSSSNISSNYPLFVM